MWIFIDKLSSTEWRDQKISSRPIPRLIFETKVFETETFFWDQNFRDRYRDFFRDQIFSRSILRLFFETNHFRDWYRDFLWDQNFWDRADTLKKLRKVTIPRSLETRCHTLLSSSWKPQNKPHYLGDLLYHHHIIYINKSKSCFNLLTHFSPVVMTWEGLGAPTSNKKEQSWPKVARWVDRVPGMLCCIKRSRLLDF